MWLRFYRKKMFKSLFERKKTLSGSLVGFTDYHSHILPGVDDGVKTIDEALAVLALYERAGISDVWLTPHVMEDVPNTVAGLKARFGELTEAYSGGVRLHLASENMLDSLFAERLDSGDLLPIELEWPYLLVETSFVNPPARLYEMMEEIKSKGYYPMLAHPERYVYMERKDYRRLCQAGVVFQLNILSASGHYGPDARHKAEWLMGNGMYRFAGTDLHRERHFELIEKMRVGKDFAVMIEGQCRAGRDI